ncbi:T9SS type A sorting domain-containing protein [Winogradskyella helgolandensis]|uniref:T9SS type A sorting domain-containing protein n=1 Tax=Winogradskyella helgolandensis TaxID=2697010 RepID=UPI0015BEF1F4|nr:T9SS type A sorting domain-containing protein [Winogradskyella helgolandensis]
MKQTYILLIIIVLNITLSNAQTIDLITNLDCTCRLAFKGDELYFSEYDSGKISKINVTEINPVPTTILTGLNGPTALAFDGNELYIAESSGDKISKIDINDTTPVLTSVISGLDWPYSIAIKDNELYFTEFLGEISKINISQTSPIQTTLLTLGWQNKIVFNGNDLYIAEFTLSKISKIDITDSTPNTVSIASIDYPSGITLDDEDLFFAHSYENIISKKNIINDEETILITGINNPSDLEIKDNILYIVQGDKITKLDLSTLSIEDHNLINRVKLFPNPAKDIIQVSHLTKDTNFKIYNILGEQLLNGALSNDGFINIEHLNKGFYFLNLENKNVLKFLKK